MKIAVSTIMLDEPPEFIERWAASAMDADDLVLVDTGSTNDSIICARDLGITVHEIQIRPFRFDTARNTALALISPAIDVVVKVDVDEVLSPGWRDALERAERADRYSYRYVWNHDAAGNPDVEFVADHTISRWGWQWRHPVHEALYRTDGRSVPMSDGGFTIEHWADPAKSRGQYLGLLATAVAEDPEDDRMSHYYARELFFVGDWVRSRQEFVRHLALPSATWTAERAQSYLYLARMDSYPERWLLRAAAEAPERREVWVALAENAQRNEEWALAQGYAARALGIQDRTADYISAGHSWDDEALRRLVGSVPGTWTGVMTVSSDDGSDST